MRSEATKKRILILCPIEWSYGRNIILGARHHAFTSNNLEIGHGTWEPGASESLADLVKRQKIDGVIARAQNQDFENALLESGVPCVNVSNVLKVTKTAQVTQDDFSVGRLAAEHLHRCGCSHFAYWEQDDSYFSLERVRGFRDTISQLAAPKAISQGSSGPLGEEDTTKLINKMKRWLKKLPDQTGIFTVLDPYALDLIRAAKEIGRNVPEQLAILGVGNDEFWVDFEHIPLSSVKLPAWQIGAEACTLLDKMMCDSTAKQNELIRVPVTEVVPRQSTDILYTSDEAVQKAIAFIRENAQSAISVDEVVRASGISRSGLQRRFASLLDNSILSEIQAARIERVKFFLRETDMKIANIAEVCGFSDSPRLHVLFRQITDLTPAQYRQRCKFEKLA
ncbi:MAG: substrate-binding domain-containing protein [Verrucomicrobiota bacterium JB024]|nr:substrate-binding domain-containing protein [Verrucomicrobiota bacterium JB024]